MLPRLLPLLLLAAMPAFAQDRPPLFPTRDADVTYRVTGPNTLGREGDVLRIATLVAERKQRMDLEGNAYRIVDRAANLGILVDEGSRTAVRIPLDPRTMARMEPTEGATFTREGEDRIAGHACTNWSYRQGNETGRVCVTAEGVQLRMEANAPGGPARAVATAVNLGPLDPARFRIPAGYQVTDAVPPRRSR